METDVLCNECNSSTTDYEVIDEAEVCKDCVDSNYYLCNDCNVWTPQDDCHTVRGDNVVCDDCRDSYTFCDDCEEYVPDYISTYMIGRHEKIVCDECYSNDYTYCDRCDRSWHNDVMCYISNQDVCDDCREEFSYCDNCDEYYLDTCECTEQDINNYSYKPTPIFYGNDKRKLFLGLELEVEPTQDREASYRLAKELFGDLVYIKQDGSLYTSGYLSGYEIVTHPISASEFINIFPTESLELLRGAGALSWDAHYSCGIHIHMSKEAFTARHLNYFMKFIYENSNPITKYAGRDSSYAKFEVSKRDYMGVIHNKNYYNQSDRYVAVNLQNDDTVELRFFRGTLAPLTLKSYIEFVNLAYDYTKTISYNDYKSGKLSWHNFVTYTESRVAEFPNIFAHNRFTKLKGDNN